jgi:hypothetical protein
MQIYGGMEIKCHMVLTLALDAAEWLASCPGNFIPEERIPESLE